MDKWDGCATRNFFGMAVKFEPTWYQVMGGVDLSMPITYMAGLKGNSALLVGGDQSGGSYSAGLSALINGKHTLSRLAGPPRVLTCITSWLTRPEQSSLVFSPRGSSEQGGLWSSTAQL